MNGFTPQSSSLIIVRAKTIATQGMPAGAVGGMYLSEHTTVPLQVSALDFDDSNVRARTLQRVHSACSIQTHHSAKE